VLVRQIVELSEARREDGAYCYVSSVHWFYLLNHWTPTSKFIVNMVNVITTVTNGYYACVGYGGHWISERLLLGARGTVVGWDTVLQAKGRGFDYRWGNEFLNLPNPSSRTMALGSTQPLTEMGTRIVPGWGVKGGWRVRLTSSPPCWVDCLVNVGTSTSHNPWASTACYKASFAFITNIIIIA
jgi:hypothetical protein